MPGYPEIAEPEIQTQDRPGREERYEEDKNGPYVVILYNDDHTPVDAVVSQVQRATGYSLERCVGITLEAHTRGRAIAYTGSQEDCERVAGVLRQIRLQVETDRF